MYMMLHLSLFDINLPSQSLHMSISDTTARKIQAKNGIPPSISHIALASYFAVLCINSYFVCATLNRFFNMFLWRSVDVELVSHWVLLQ